MTVPLMVSITLGLDALELTITTLANEPTIWVLYLTLMVPFCPARIGSLVHSGTVQPQEACTLFRMIGTAPGGKGELQVRLHPD